MADVYDEPDQLEDSTGDDQMSLAQSISQAYSLPKDAESNIVQELRRLPGYVISLLRVFGGPSRHSFPDHGHELWHLLEKHVSNAVRCFLVMLSQIGFLLKTGKFGREYPVSMRQLVERLEIESDPDFMEEGYEPGQPVFSGHFSLSGDESEPRLLCSSSKDFYIKEGCYERGFDLSQLPPGNRIGFIGAGGGSDGIQAAMLALLCAEAGKDVAFVASVRADKTTSEDSKGRMGIARTVTDHGGEVSPGVFKVMSHTQGSGRFVENVSADDVNMFLIIEDEKNSGLADKILALIAEVNNDTDGEEMIIHQSDPTIDTLVIVDTGGDILQPAQDVPAWKQHQDLRVVHSLASQKSPLRASIPDLDIRVAIVAPGIDAPPNACSLLREIKPAFLLLDSKARRLVTETYQRWNFTGAESGLQAGRYGKTPFAWQAAMQASEEIEAASEQWSKQNLTSTSEASSRERSRILRNGYLTAAVPLPANRVLDDNNPWNPFVPLQQLTAGILFMPASRLLEVIAPKLD